jgi:nitrogen fixation/metabolism regulation signal transduction histidine kinase
MLSLTQFVFVVVVGICIVVLAFEYSHRVVGPAHRISTSLRKVRAGELEPIRLRKGDELQSLVDELNLLIADLAARRDPAAPTPAPEAPASSSATPQVQEPAPACTRSGEGDGC